MNCFPVSVRYLSLIVPFLFPFSTYADGTKLAGNSSVPQSHAPIGVMGDHIHKKGEWMISYRYMNMSMEDNLLGNDNISPEEIVTSINNRFANPPMMPPTLRVVPTEMTTEMHMVGAMYAPSDNITLMAMVNSIQKEMDHITFQGGMGTNQLGTFTTKTSGLGDIKLAALWNMHESGPHQLIANFGLSLPTGDIDKTDQILTPMNMTPSPRLPYAMQLGSGTYDIEPGLTYLGHQHNWAWGAQLKAVVRLGTNDESYTLGNKTMITGWTSYQFNSNISGSLRITYHDSQAIDGLDPQIAAPVQTANPDNYGGERLDIGFGMNFLARSGHRLALEYEHTVDQDANGVQMEMQNMLTLGYQLAF